MIFFAGRAFAKQSDTHEDQSFSGYRKSENTLWDLRRLRPYDRSASPIKSVDHWRSYILAAQQLTVSSMNSWNFLFLTDSKKKLNKNFDRKILRFQSRSSYGKTGQEMGIFDGGDYVRSNRLINITNYSY